MELNGNKITKNTHVVAVEHYLAEDGTCVTERFFQRMFFLAQQILTVIRNTNLFRQPTMDELVEFEHGLTTISDEEQQIILDYEDKNIYQTCLTKPVLRTLHHNHFGEGGKIEAVICQYCNLKILSKTSVPVICHSTRPLNFKSIIHGLSAGLYKTSDIKVLAKSPNEILQIEIASDNMYIPKLVSGMDNGPGGQFTGRTRKAKMRITNSTNFVNEPIFESFSASLGLGESSSAIILEKCLKSFFPRVIIPTDKLQATTQLICKLPLLENILEQDLLLPPDVEESTRNPRRRLVSLKRKSERRESRQDELNHIDDKQFRSFNLLCQMFEINGLAGLKQFYNCIESSMLACFWETYRQSAYNSFKLDPTGVPTISAYTFQAFLFYSKTKIKISPRSFLAHLDVNSMYPFTMKSFNFPSGNYEWMDRAELNALVFPPRQHWREITLDEPSRDVDYILEFDLLYPPDLHSDTASLPLGFQHLILSYFVRDEQLTSS
ncbi:unnamed protein product, partial [Allacma fusca]